MIEPIMTQVMRPLFQTLFTAPAATDDELPAGTYLVIGNEYLSGSSGEYFIVG